MEPQKKDLLAICNACGFQKKLDSTHKAGKQLMKDVPNFYQANPEFKGKTNKAAVELGKMAQQQKAEIGTKKVKISDENEEQKV